MNALAKAAAYQYLIRKDEVDDMFIFASPQQQTSFLIADVVMRHEKSLFDMISTWSKLYDIKYGDKQ